LAAARAYLQAAKEVLEGARDTVNDVRDVLDEQGRELQRHIPFYLKARLERQARAAGLS